MKPNIHPVYTQSDIVCACGATVPTRSTRSELRLDICAQCHPFFTGKQKLMDTEGRIERYRKKYAKTQAAQ